MLAHASAPQRRHLYHPQLRLDVWHAQDPWLYQHLRIPRSTRLSWRDRPPPKALVGAELFDTSDIALRARLVRLQRRNAVLWAIVRVLFTLVRVLSVSLRARRLPEGRDKARILGAVQRSAVVLGLAPTLRLCGLSASRYHDWKNRPSCLLDDRNSCPRRSPTKMRFGDIEAIGHMLLDTALRHMSTAQLALYAQRIGKVFAASSTWYRYMRLHGWTRPLVRIHYPPKSGIRACRPNEIWHIDETLVRLTDGTRLYIQAVIDNFSRFILAWRVSTQHGGAYSLQLLREADNLLRDGEPPPTLVCDNGSENFNHLVDEHIDSGVLQRVLARVDIVHSNSMIERFWMALKHRCLYLHDLATQTLVVQRTAFFVTQHNSVAPQVVHSGRTPHEVYFGLNQDLPQRLADERARAQQQRIDHNRKLACGNCQPKQTSPPTADTRLGRRDQQAGKDSTSM